MYPILLKTPWFTVYSYGFMLSMTFVVAAGLLFLELRRRRMDEELLGPVVILAIVFGLLGSKLFAAFERWESFTRDPVHFMLSGSGLTFLGGFLMATLAIWGFLRLRKVPFLLFCDATAPGLMLGYGVARVGCQLAGDGDYGIASSLPWAMAYPHGMVPTTQLVHPTPVYETLASIVLFAFLWRKRTEPRGVGWLFGLYLIVSASARFLVEFIRLNPKYMLGLSQSQLISLALVGLGVVLMFLRSAPAQAASVASQPPAKSTPKQAPVQVASVTRPAGPPLVNPLAAVLSADELSRLAGRESPSAAAPSEGEPLGSSEAPETPAIPPSAGSKPVKATAQPKPKPGAHPTRKGRKG